MQLLLIKINSFGDNPEYALLGKKQKEDRFTPGDWKKIRSVSRGRRVLLIIPNEDVVLTSVTIPSKNKKQLLQAIPFALEDNLAEDIEELHFAIFQEKPQGETHVAVINRDRLDDYLSLLKDNGLTAHFVLPQVLVQTIKKDAWSLLESHDNSVSDSDNQATVSVRLNKYAGFFSDKSLLELFIQQLEEDKPELLLSNIAADELPKELQDIALEALDPAQVFYESANSAIDLNLLSGFVSNKKESHINWKAWRPAFVIASMLLATWIGILGWQNTKLQKQRKQLDQSINNLFTATFPKSRIVDPAQQMASKLNQLKKNAGGTVSSPLPLIADISPLLKEYKDLSLNEIRFKENKLELVVQSPNLSRLETFKKDVLKKSNLQLEISSSTTTADKVEAILLVSPLNESNKEKA